MQHEQLLKRCVFTIAIIYKCAGYFQEFLILHCTFKMWITCYDTSFTYNHFIQRYSNAAHYYNSCA